MAAAHLVGLPRATARNVRRGRLADDLEHFDDERVRYARRPLLFKGPLVLLPEGSLSRAPVNGRYTAVFDERDIAYTASFVGVSFFGKPYMFARALSAVMHSRLVAYQLAFMGGTVGVKQTKIELADLNSVRFPPIENFSSTELQALSDAFEILTEEPHSSALKKSTAIIDRIVEKEAGLSDNDRDLLIDSDRRTEAIFFETATARRSMEARPKGSEMTLYAKNLCTTFNAFGSEADDQVLTPDRYIELTPDIVVVKLTLTTRSEMDPSLGLKHGQLNELDDFSIDALGGTELPYLKPAKTLRFYVGRQVYLLKPAQYRYFSPAAGQSDADRIVADLMDPGFLND